MEEFGLIKIFAFNIGFFLKVINANKHKKVSMKNKIFQDKKVLHPKKIESKQRKS